MLAVFHGPLSRDEIVPDDNKSIYPRSALTTIIAIGLRWITMRLLLEHAAAAFERAALSFLFQDPPRPFFVPTLAHFPPFVFLLFDVSI